MINQQMIYRYLPFIWAAILIVAYILPWVTTPNGSLTMGGYDLAEWASLHPAVWTGDGLTRLTPLLLRLPLVGITVLLAFTVPRSRDSMRWWLAVGGVILLCVAQLPPLEFITLARSNPNYQQQFILAAVSLAGGLFGLFRRATTSRTPLGWWLAAVSGMAGLAGLFQAMTLLRREGLQPGWGVGAIVFIVTAMFIIPRTMRLYTPTEKE